MRPTSPFPIIDSHTHFPVVEDGYYDAWEAEYAARFGAEKLRACSSTTTPQDY